MKTIALREMIYRKRSATGLSAARRFTIAISEVVEVPLGEPGAGFLCLVTSGPSPEVSNKIYGPDSIATLTAAIGAVNAYCEFLHDTGELRMQSNELYDPDLHGVFGMCKRANRASEFKKGFDFGSLGFQRPPDDQE